MASNKSDRNPARMAAGMDGWQQPYSRATRNRFRLRAGAIRRAILRRTGIETDIGHNRLRSLCWPVATLRRAWLQAERLLVKAGPA